MTGVALGKTEVTVTANDDVSASNSTATATFEVIVVNVMPVIKDLPGRVEIGEGDTIMVMVEITDADDTTHTVTAQSQDEAHVLATDGNPIMITGVGMHEKSTDTSDVLVSVMDDSEADNNASAQGTIAVKVGDRCEVDDELDDDSATADAPQFCYFASDGMPHVFSVRGKTNPLGCVDGAVGETLPEAVAGASETTQDLCTDHSLSVNGLMAEKDKTSWTITAVPSP